MLFGLKNPHQNQLCEILNGYARNGVPQARRSYEFEFYSADMVAAAVDYLEHIHGSWKEFISVDAMPDNEIKIQSAIWELVTTEIDYIHALQTVTDVSLARPVFRFRIVYFSKMKTHDKHIRITHIHITPHAHPYTLFNHTQPDAARPDLS